MMANSGRSLRGRMLDAMLAVVECDAEDERAWESAWRRLHFAAKAWVGSNPMPRHGPKEPCQSADTPSVVEETDGQGS